MHFSVRDIAKNHTVYFVIVFLNYMVTTAKTWQHVCILIIIFPENLFQIIFVGFRVDIKTSQIQMWYI